MKKINTNQAAELFAHNVKSPTGQTPHISVDNIRVWTDLNALHNLTPHERNRTVDEAEVIELAKKTVFLPNYQLGQSVYRVSVKERAENYAYSAEDGRLLRTHSGVDFDLLSDSDPDLGGVEGCWATHKFLANRMRHEHPYLFGSAQGLVHPACIRKVKDWEAVQGSARRYYHTEKPSPQDYAELGIYPHEYLLIIVPKGSICGMDFDIQDQ